VARAIRYQDMSLPGNVTAQLTLSGTTVTALSYDADGDGTADTAQPPTVDITGPVAQDVTPPLITISTDEQPTTTRVALTATDSGSGVKGLYYSLDGTTFQPYTQPFDL